MIRRVFAITLLLVLAGCSVTVVGPSEPSVPSAVPATAAQATDTSTPPPPSPTPTPSRAESEFDGAAAYADVEVQMAFGPRPTGSEASRLTGDYIAYELAEAGWDVSEQTFTYMGTRARNIVGRAGQGDERTLVIGAHYDTRREADRDPDSPEEPVPGANDGASGVAVLLELGRVVDLDAFDGEVWLVFFDAEDNGHLDGWEYIAGSRAFVSDLERPPEAAIIVDMIGDADQQIYREATSDDALTSAIWATAAGLGYSEYFIDEVGYSILDDHTPFLEIGVDAIDIIDFNYPHWHTTGDTIDKVSADSLERVGRVLEEFLEAGAEY